VIPFLVSHYAVDAVFPKAAPILAKALGTHTGLTLADLGAICSNRGAFLFVNCIDHPKDAMVGRFETWNGQQVFNILAMGGEGEHWPEAMETIKQFARQYGASKIVFHGRRGWARALPETREIYRTYAIELEN
jgi:hypothetical protein